MSTDSSVSLAVLFQGFEAARRRFMQDRLGPDAGLVYASIFEALNWVVSIDERVGLRARDPSGIALGVRYARHAVHHKWADALELTYGAQLPAPLPAPLFEWQWRDEFKPPENPTGRDEYAARLAGNPVRFTLDALSDLIGGVVPP